MTPQQIRASLILAGITGKKIAESVGMSPQAVSLAIYGKYKNPRIKKAIAEAVGRPYEDVWPDDVRGR